MTRKQSRTHAPRPAGRAALDHLPSGPVPLATATAELLVRDDGVLLLLDGTESSFVDLSDPARLDFEYQQHMDAAARVLLGQGTALRAAHLGGAACALARAWDATRPGSTQLAVELDAVLAERVREWFDLPRSPALRIRVGDAAQVAPTLREGQWDVVVRDVFAGGLVPEPVRTGEFVAACARALAPGGLYLANVASAPRAVAGAELARVREVFTSVAVIADNAVARGRRRGNLVVVASASQWEAGQREELERAVRRLPLPVRTWEAEDPALPRP